MLGPNSTLPEATAVIKTQHTCCGWVHAAGGSWGTWKWKTQPFLNCRRGIKKQYSAESFPSLSLCGSPSPMALAVTGDNSRFPLCRDCSIPEQCWGFQAEMGLVLPHTACVWVWLLHQDHPTYPPCGFCWMGWWWSNPYLRMKPSCCCLTVAMQDMHSWNGVKEPWPSISLLPMNCFHEPFWRIGVGLGCSSALGENLTKHLMGLESLTSSSHEPSWIWQIPTSLLCL